MNIIKQNNKNIDYDTPALEIIGFGKKYARRGEYAVKDVNFKVFPGEFHGFIGANGAGKTTTIKSIIGAYARYEGNVNIYGEKNTKKSAKLRLGYIPEAANFPTTLNTYEYISRMASLSGMSLSKSKKFAKEKLKEIGLEKLMYKKPSTFSSGQKKKVLLAQALVNNPDVIVMDEPAANLDPKARNEFFTELKKLQKQGKSIFISSHILSELGQFIDSVTIVDGGKVVFTGKMDEITNKDTNEYHISFSTKTDEDKFETYVKKNNIPKSESKIRKGTFTYEFPTEAAAMLALKFITTNKIVITTFDKDRTSLQDAYDNFVKFGSVDSGHGNYQGETGGKNA